MGTDIQPPGAAHSLAGDPRFAELRGAYRRFVFPVAVAFLLWFLTYVLCSAYARGFMAKQVVGNINVALVFGLLQFVSTFGIALVYGRYANRRLDPIAAELRAGARATIPAARAAEDAETDGGGFAEATVTAPASTPTTHPTHATEEDPA
jgi:uncharacterized membrane protein (DUF485 family)